MKRFDFRPAPLACLIALSLLLAACGSDDSAVVVNGVDDNVDMNGEGSTDSTGEGEGDGTGEGEDTDGEGTADTETVSLVLDSQSTVPPANVAAATGSGSFTVDTVTGAISGSVTVSGTSGQPTAAHIHSGGTGESGPVVIGLEGNADGTVWSTPAGATLDTSALALYEAGELYVNVHTSANEAGELRSQLTEAGTPSSADSVTITLTNTSDFQPMTPPVVLLHNAPNADNGIRIFEVGQPAIDQLVRIAEDGDFGPMVELAELQTTAGAVSASGVAFADPDNPGPLTPGATATIELDLSAENQVMTLISMVVCTNDGFSGIDSRALPETTETFTAPIYDAGSETNVLTLDYWVPPCSEDGQSPNSGDDENGSITPHPGQSASENSDFDFEAGTEYLEVTVTRN
jgi:hypothetical protein